MLFIIQRYGILPSISDSTYRLEGQSRWLFLAFLWSVGFLNLFQGLGAWGFWATACLLFAGITIDHREQGANTRVIHIVGATGAIIFSLIGLWVIYEIWFPVVLIGIFTYILYNHKNFIWWIEIAAFVVIYGAYLLRPLFIV